MVPNKLPDSHNELTADRRRERAMKNVRTNLVEATKRLTAFVADKSYDDIIRQVHTAKTETVNDNDDPEIVTYYTLWTDFGDMRLTESGKLLRCDDEHKYSDVTHYGVDHSESLSLSQIQADKERFSTTHLLSLAHQLDRFLKPKNDTTIA